MHQANRRALFALLSLSLLALSACADDGTPDEPNVPVEGDDGAALSDLDVLLDGVPSNDELPLEGKADQVFPAQYDLVELQSPVKSQGSRGVCSIFSTVGLMEHLYIKEGSYLNPDFSEQFLQWSAKVEAGRFPNSGGSNAAANLTAINSYGIVLEEDEPYQTQPWGTANDDACEGDRQPTKCYTNGDPSEHALQSERWHLPRHRYVNSRPQSIKAFMTDNKTAVVAGMKFFYQSWNHRKTTLHRNLKYWNEGYVLYPNADDKRESKPAGHSILIVGWDDELEVPMQDKDGNPVMDSDGNPMMEKGFWVFKNSWGTTGFGIDNEFGPGYGYLSMRYVSEYASVVSTGIPALQPRVEICGDGEDNDENGATDCDDAACANDATCQGGDYSYENDSELDIPDNDLTGVDSVIEVDDTGTIGELNVTVNIAHSYRADLIVKLYSPSGTVVTLHDQTGSSADDLRKTYTVSDFDGESIEGTWTLTVADSYASDEGVLEGWGLEIELAE